MVTEFFRFSEGGQHENIQACEHYDSFVSFDILRFTVYVL